MVPSLLLANEAMAFLTILIVFPGLFDPGDRSLWFPFVAIFVLMSFVWWVFLLTFPIALLALWWLGEPIVEAYKDSWPWRRIADARPAYRA